ncbi:hypothetical protein FAES_0874 [Fibrella aestuarina BUZ 2]|uniref:Uncharacterized protein n=1 Tax=Fibrella aestuarina BUZ 2 TaxID=1166018 RepID=I0K432_9BACT|nr:hypothetical protein FAES_0874 [Fibrella aestuarina BUZ 2]
MGVATFIGHTRRYLVKPTPTWFMLGFANTVLAIAGPVFFLGIDYFWFKICYGSNTYEITDVTSQLLYLS